MQKLIAFCPNQNQINMFKNTLKQFINLKDPLTLLADQIPWHEFEEEFADLYSHTGTPAKPIRLMVSLLILKQIKDLGDEPLVSEWVQNPYFQYFSGEAEFQWEPPCDPSDLVHFRKRIGQRGVEKILQVSIKVQPAKDLRSVTREICIDTSVQEKNITYPTDVKLRKKVIDQCVKIARKEGIVLRQSYKRTAKKLVLAQRFAHHPRNYKKARAAKRKLKTIAERLVRELQRKLPEGRLVDYQDKLTLFTQVINQQKSDKNKLYSLHEPGVACIAKGKVAKKFEFGSKVSIAMGKNRTIVLGVVNFKGNPHDSNTIEATLEQVKRLTGKKIQKAIVDRGYRTKKKFGETEIVAPKPSRSPAEKAAYRKRFRRRAAIEPIIGHMKNQYGMDRNYLKGELGDIINATLAGAALNFKRWLNIKLKELSWLINQLTASVSENTQSLVI